MASRAAFRLLLQSRNVTMAATRISKTTTLTTIATRTRLKPLPLSAPFEAANIPERAISLPAGDGEAASGVADSAGEVDGEAERLTLGTAAGGPTIIWPDARDDELSPAAPAAAVRKACTKEGRSGR
jgi:hypothetical protein